MLPTASELPRVMECTASAVMPRVHSSNKYSERGNVIHHFLHTVRKAGRVVALQQLGECEERAVCESIDVTALPIAGDPEVTFAYDHVTGKARRLGSSLGRDYSAATDTEFVGTVDLIEVMGGVARVYDYKSGFMGVSPDSWQLKMLALAAARTAGVDEAETFVLTIKDDGRVVPVSMMFTAFDLDVIADELNALAGRIAKLNGRALGELTVVEGQHCKYCPAIQRCPAKVSLLRNINGELGKFDADGPMVSLEELGEAWTRMKAARALLDRVESSIKEIAMGSDVPLPSGKVLRPVEQEREFINPATAYEVLEKLYGVDVAEQVVEQKASKTSLKRVLNGKAEAALKAIREAGGVEVTVNTTVVEMKP